MTLFNRKSRYLGIDLSAASVKLVELSRAGQRYQIEACAIEPIPAGAMENRNPNDLVAVAAAVRRAVKESGTRLSEAVVAVPATSVITRTVSLPAELNERDIEATLTLEAAQYIPFPLEEVYLEFELLGRARADPSRQEVLLVASRRENVDLRTEALEEAGLAAAIVDVETYAVESAFRVLANALPQHGDDARYALIDLGATHSTLYVLQHGHVIHAPREQAFGGNLLTQAITDSRRETGQAREAAPLEPREAAEVALRYRTTIAGQIAQMLQFFYSSSHHAGVEHVILSGGGALMPGLARAVGTALQVPSVIANPFDGMLAAPRLRLANRHAAGNPWLTAGLLPALDSAPAMRHGELSRQAARFVVACGLALRSFD